jgi:hypothetical protein
MDWIEEEAKRIEERNYPRINAKRHETCFLSFRVASWDASG